jgi:hypothetical protein
MVGVETAVGFSFSLLCARMLGKTGDLGYSLSPLSSLMVTNHHHKLLQQGVPM